MSELASSVASRERKTGEWSELLMSIVNYTNRNQWVLMEILEKVGTWGKEGARQRVIDGQNGIMCGVHGR